MLMSLLTSTVDKARTVEISEAALYALLGFLVVLSGIIVLIFCVWLIGKIMSSAKGGSVKAPTAVKTESKPEPKPQAVATEASDEISDETIAVIMAAIAAYYEKNNPKCEFTVKRIKKFKEKYYA